MTDDRDRLDPDLAAALAGAHSPADAEAEVLARVRSRVMQRIAQDSTAHHTFLHADEGRWHPLLPGIQRKVLQEKDGVMSYLLKFAPGAVLPAHRHPMDEECVVLEGTLRIGDKVMPAGSFHAVRADVLDADSSSDTGAVIYLRGATPRADHLV